MGFLYLSSKNPKLSFIIKKNPNNGMLIREKRQGHIFGYYSSNDTVFNVFFKDRDGESSYSKTEEHNYFDASRYSAPEFVLDAISEFFSHVIKKQDVEDTEGFEHNLTVNMMAIKKKYLDIFSKYFPRVNITSEELCPNNFKITFSTKYALKELLAFVQLFAIFNVLKNRFLDDGEVEKYIDYLTQVKAPYFIKYVFKVNLLSDKKKFERYKGKLEENSFETISFKHGFASQQRIDAVQSFLDFTRSIVDMGCGEGNFAKKFAHRIPDNTYYAIDKEDDLLDTVKRRVKDATNVLTGNEFPEVPEDVDVIFSEVMEHMSIEEASALVKSMMARPNVKQIIITTPNKDFNVHYQFEDDELRHDDHHFEMTKDEFVAWVKEVCGDREYKLFDIGDVVDGIPCSLGVKI